MLAALVMVNAAVLVQATGAPAGTPCSIVRMNSSIPEAANHRAQDVVLAIGKEFEKAGIPRPSTPLAPQRATTTLTRGRWR